MSALLLTSLEAAALLGVSRPTFNRWVTEGRIPAECKATTQFGGWPRYYRHQIERLGNGELAYEEAS